MPNAGDEERNQRGETDHHGKAGGRGHGFTGDLHAALCALPADPERNGVVEIDGDVARERHVPALPKVDDVGAFVGRGEV